MDLFILGMEYAFIKTIVIFVTLLKSFSMLFIQGFDEPGGPMIRPALKGRILSKIMMLAVVFVGTSGFLVG